MKISFFTPLNDKGISIYSKRLTGELMRKGIEIILIGPEKIPDSSINPFRLLHRYYIFHRYGREMNEGDIAHIQHEYTVFSSIKPVLNLYPVFRKAIKKPTVITIHEFDDIRLGSRGSWGKRAAKKFIYTLLGGKKYLDYLNRGIFMECNAIIVHTKSSADILTARGISLGKIFVIPHPIASLKKSGFDTVTDKAYFHAEGYRTITTFGSIQKRKGQLSVIHILSELPEDIVYIIAGDILEPDYYTSLKDAVTMLHLTDRVIFTGFIQTDDINRLMNATDIFLAPFDELTASGTISEAIAYHKPIIASDIQYVTDINTAIPCIKTYSWKDAHSLKEAILYFLLDERNQRQYIEQTRAYTKAFSYEKMAQLTMDVYKKVYETA